MALRYHVPLCAIMLVNVTRSGQPSGGEVAASVGHAHVLARKQVCHCAMISYERQRHRA